MSLVKTARRAGTKIGLTQPAVIAKAVEILDEEGIGAVSMRRLAAALDVEAQSLYNHVPNKQALIDGIVCSVLTGACQPSTGSGWAERLADHLDRVRACFVAHPNSYELMLQASLTNPAIVQVNEERLAILEESGLRDLPLRQAFILVHAAVDGFAIGERWRAPLRPLPPEDRPMVSPALAAVGEALLLDDPDEHFRFVVSCLIDQVRRMVRSSRRP